jgi:hypothetical protein
MINLDLSKNFEETFLKMLVSKNVRQCTSPPQTESVCMEQKQKD